MKPTIPDWISARRSCPPVNRMGESPAKRLDTVEALGIQGIGYIKRVVKSVIFQRSGLFGLVVCTIAAASMVSGTMVAFLSPEAPTKISERTLTFAQRVAYQRAIEEVYWRHRIWPKERPDPKPSLDAMMSQTQLENKVAGCLRDSLTLEDYRQRPITAEQLQAEIDRMARHTKQPQVLRELFEALGNDPAVIAECLARPVLTERLIAELSMQNQSTALSLSGLTASVRCRWQQS